MAITAKLYGLFFTSLMRKEVDMVNDAIAVQLHTSAYTPDQDVHQYKSSLTNEIAATGGYTAGGKDLTGKTLTYTPGTNTWMFDAADLQWALADITFRTAVALDRTPATDATRPLIGYQQSDTDIVASGGNLDIVWNAAGIVSIVVA
jgi:hypothetical protein